MTHAQKMFYYLQKTIQNLKLKFLPNNFIGPLNNTAKITHFTSKLNMLAHFPDFSKIWWFGQERFWKWMPHMLLINVKKNQLVN